MKYKAFHKLSYGLYLIATEHEGKKYGYVGNTAFQVTSIPPKVAISSNKNNHTTGQILKSGKFSISVLEQKADTSIIGEFGFMSGTEIDKFTKVKPITAVTGAPIITDSCVAWFDCRVLETFDVGSHLLIIGEVLESDVISDDEPLTYRHYREKYKMLAPKNAPTYVDKETLDKEQAIDEEQTIEKEKEEKNDSNITEPDSADGADIYVCQICGFQYDPEEGDPAMGIPPGTPFEDLPEDYKCPICNAGKDYFSKV